MGHLGIIHHYGANLLVDSWDDLLDVFDLFDGTQTFWATFLMDDISIC